MKVLLLALFVAAATAAPLDDDSGPVEVIVNGVPDGHPLDIADVVDIKLQEHQAGQLLSATNLLHPYTAEGIAEAVAAAEAIAVEPVNVVEQALEAVVPEPVVLPQPVAPEVVLPEPVVLPAPVLPEVVLPEPVVVPEPVALPEAALPEVVIPEPVVLPAPVAPEVVPEVVESIPEPSPQFTNGEIYNDGNVQVTLNASEDPGVIATLQSWFSLVLNYFNTGVQTTQQII